MIAGTVAVAVVIVSVHHGTNCRLLGLLLLLLCLRLALAVLKLLQEKLNKLVLESRKPRRKSKE